MPGGIFLSVGAIVAMGLVFAAKKVINSINDTQIQAQLVSEFDRIEGEYRNENQVKPGMEHSAELVDDNQQQRVLNPTVDATVVTLPTTSAIAMSTMAGKASQVGMFASANPDRDDKVKPAASSSVFPVAAHDTAADHQLNDSWVDDSESSDADVPHGNGMIH